MLTHIDELNRILKPINIKGISSTIDLETFNKEKRRIRSSVHPDKHPTNKEYWEKISQNVNSILDEITKSFNNAVQKSFTYSSQIDDPREINIKVSLRDALRGKMIRIKLPSADYYIDFTQKTSQKIIPVSFYLNNFSKTKVNIYYNISESIILQVSSSFVSFNVTVKDDELYTFSNNSLILSTNIVNYLLGLTNKRIRDYNVNVYTPMGIDEVEVTPERVMISEKDGLVIIKSAGFFWRSATGMVLRSPLVMPFIVL